MSRESRIESFLTDRRIPFKPSRRSFITDCVNPSCGKEDHLWIRKTSGRAICFKCNMRWDWIGFVARILRCSIEDARKSQNFQGAGDEIHKPIDIDRLFNPKAYEHIEEDTPITMGPDFIPLAQSEVGLQYVRSRGITRPEIIANCDLRYHAVMNAVVFPVSLNGIIYGWQARKISPLPGELRLISSVFNKSHFLLNWDRAKIEKKIVLVEGPFDCLHVDLPGHGAVASLGKGVSSDQIAKLLNSSAEVIYLGLDPDACDEVYEVLSRIGLTKKVYRILPPIHRKDFGECTEEEVLKSFESAVHLNGHIALLEVFLK